jgi:maltokinase
VTTTLPAGLEELLPDYLGMQRWYAGAEVPPAGSVRVEHARELWSGDEGHRLWHAVVAAGSDRYQVLLGERPAGERADFLHGHEEAVIGSLGDSYFYDATLDGEMARSLLEAVSGGQESAKLARPISAEQSNTSIVYDDRLILKVFRRLHAGHNPDVEVTTSLAAFGFEHVAAPLVTWRDYGYDLAFGQQFLVGGSEGWALALTSLRDLYNSSTDLPAEAGGDFAAEASRLGHMTADMHIALAGGFGMVSRTDATAGWTALVDGFRWRLAAATELAGVDLLAGADPLLARLEAVEDPGPFFRVHGDYHLGQVMRTDTGWYVLDFEGEPIKTMAERGNAESPLKDVSGMLRSFHYASRHALRERLGDEQEALGERALAWEAHNRQAFLEGYRDERGIDGLLPGPDVVAAVLIAYELDKALYELDYERAHRPDWVTIPVDALERLIQGGEAGA